MAVPLTLPSVGVTTSELLIQKLRGTADPIPVSADAHGGPSSISKIHLATLAWTQSQDPSPSSAVHIPQISSLLLSWIVDSLARATKGINSKAKADDSTSTATTLANPEYYTLLHTLLKRSSRESVSPSTASAQTVLSIVSSLLSLPQDDLRRCIPQAAEPLVLLLQPVISALANGQATRATLDELLTSVFRSIAQLEASDFDLASGLAQLLQVIKDHWIDATAESSLLSHKSHSTFITSSLSPWSQALDTLASISRQQNHSQSFQHLRQLVLDVGHGCLFGLYGIKSILFPTAFAKNVAPTASVLQAITNSTDIVSSVALPQLAWAAVRSTRRHSSELQAIAKAHSAKSDVPLAEDDTAAGSTGKTTNLQALLFDSFLRPLLDVALLHPKACATILIVLAESNLSSSLSRHPSWEQALTSTARALIGSLQTTEDGTVLEHCITALHSLWQIDQDALRSDIPHLLSSLCMFPSSRSLTQACQMQAQLLLDDLFKSFARSQETPEMLHMLGRAYLSSSHNQWHDGALFQPRYMNTVVSTYVRNSISPPQLKQTLEQVSDLIRSAMAASTSPSANGNGKKRSHAEADGDQDFNSTRVTNALRYVHPILASMPIPAAMIEELRPVLQSISSTLTSLVATVLSSEQETSTGTPLKKARKGGGQDDSRPNTQNDSIPTGASALWAFYGLCAGLKSVDINSAESDFPETSQALALFQSLWPNLLSASIQNPTVMLETVRLVLFAQELQLEGGRGDTLPSGEELQPVWSAVLRFVDASVGSPQQAPLWEVMLTRFSFVLEHTADAQVLLGLSQTFIDSLRPEASSEALHAISLRACQNAEFLELTRWRDCIIGLISSQCQGENASDGNHMDSLSALAHFPLQYIPPDTREELLILALRVSSSTTSADKGAEAGVALVRRWLLQAAQSSGSGSLSEKVTVAVKHSLLSLVRGGEQTVELLCAWIARLLENKQMTADELQNLVNTHMSGSASVQVAVAETLVASGSGSEMIGVVTFPALSLDRLKGQAVEGLDGTAVTEYLKRAKLTLVLAGVQEEPQQTSANIVAQSFFSLTPRLAEITDDDNHNSLAQEYLSLAAVLIRHCASSNAEAQRISDETMHGMVLLLSCNRKDTEDDVVDKAFSQFMRVLSPEQYDVILTGLAKGQEDHVHLRGVLRTLSSALRFGPEGTLVIAQKHFTRFLLRVQASLSLFLQGHSDGNAILDHLEALSTICTGRVMVLRNTDAPIVLSILSLVVSPPSSSSHSVLRNALSTPLSTRRTLAQEIFTATLDIVNTLIRLRKDILKPVLPQLSLLLTQMPRLFVRPTMASTSTRSRQMRVFLASCPIWLARSFVADRSGPLASVDANEDEETSLMLDSAGGLNSANARQFARVLDTLTSKSAVSASASASHRGHAPSSSGDTSQTDSLARPISKHAIYILTSYIHALLHPIPTSSSSGNASTSVMRALIPPDTRKELLTGLQSLCGVINESERDWILAVDVLDDAGKGVFKEVWRAWEGERYKGE